MADCLIGLGSNIGDRTAQLDQAIALICGFPQTRLLASSRYHQTQPIGGPQGQAPFLNAAVRATTSLSPLQLLALLHHAEEALGRRRVRRWGPRTIDIDLLLYDRLILETGPLLLPHPRMAVRRFVLEPACEIAGDMIHALTGWTLAKLLARLGEPLCYVALAGASAAIRTEIVTAAAAVRQARLLCAPLREPPTAVSASGGTPDAALQRELDMLTEQTRMLSSLATSGTHPVPVLSNFWLNQCLAIARSWPPGDAQSRLEQACLAAIARAPQPRFLLFLEALRDAGAGGVPDEADAAQGGAQPCVSAWASDIPRSALREQIARPGQCPVIRVADADVDLAVSELTAAIDAMQ